MSLELATQPDNRAVVSAGVTAGERRDIATRFQPGRVNNPHGRPPSARFRKAALKLLRQEIAAGIDRLDCITDAVISKAETGDTTAYAILRDTVDGKPGNGESGGVTQIAIVVENIAAD